MRNLALIVGALVVLTVGFVLATGGGDKGDATSAGTTTTQATAAPAATTTSGGSTSTPVPDAAPAVPTLVYAGGKAQGGVRTLDYDKGDQVAFKVRSDVADEVHVHGFDKMQDVPAGGTISFAFKAKFDGKYVVEIEGSSTQIASLEIQP